MPAYDYICRDCEKPFVVRMSISAYSVGDAPPCPACESTNVERSLGKVTVLTGGRGGSSTASCGPAGSGFS